MKDPFLTGCVIGVMMLVFGMGNLIRQDIKGLNRETQVHWMLPSDAKCAVKLMYFKDKDGVRYPANQMVCHFDAALAQPIRPEPKQNLEVMQEKYQED